jgi:hypothetical protein
MEDKLTRVERIQYELQYVEIELNNLSEGQTSQYSKDYLNGAKDVLQFIMKLENEKSYA